MSLRSNAAQAVAHDIAIPVTASVVIGMGAISKNVLLAGGGTVAPRSRTTIRINGNQLEAMLGRTDSASDRASSGTSRNVDEDVIDYLKLSKPSLKDIAVRVPFYPLNAIVPTIRAKLEGEGCDITESLVAFEEVFVDPGPFAYRGFEHFNANRPDGNILHISLVKQKNAEVARQMRQKQDNEAWWYEA